MGLVLPLGFQLRFQYLVYARTTCDGPRSLQLRKGAGMGSRTGRSFGRQRVLQGRRRTNLSHLFDLWSGRRRVPGHLQISRRNAERARRERTLSESGGLGAPAKHVRRWRNGGTERALPPAGLRLHGASTSGGLNRHERDTGPREFTTADVRPPVCRFFRLDYSGRNSGATAKVPDVSCRLSGALDGNRPLTLSRDTITRVASDSVRRIDFIYCGTEHPAPDSQIWPARKNN